MSDPIYKRLRTIHLCCAAGVLLAVGSTTALAVLPMLKSGRASIQQAEDYRGKLREIEGLSMKLQEVKARIGAIETEIAREEKRLPTRNQMDQFMDELSSVAREAGVTVEGFEKSEIQTIHNRRALPAKLTASGTYAQCYKFLAGLRKMERLTRLENAMIDSEQKTGEDSKPGEKGNCRLRVAIATFMAK